MMQLMGVYNTGKCNVNAQYWTRNHDNVKIIVSSNAAINIKTADTYWISTGIAATLFLGVVSFCGWWYQRRLRGLFRELVSDIGNPATEREDIVASRPAERGVEMRELVNGNVDHEAEEDTRGFVPARDDNVHHMRGEDQV